MTEHTAKEPEGRPDHQVVRAAEALEPEQPGPSTSPHQETA